jgi:hypothetical protein
MSAHPALGVGLSVETLLREAGQHAQLLALLADPESDIPAAAREGLVDVFGRMAQAFAALERVLPAAVLNLELSTTEPPE